MASPTFLRPLPNPSSTRPAASSASPSLRKSSSPRSSPAFFFTPPLMRSALPRISSLFHIRSLLLGATPRGCTSRSFEYGWAFDMTESQRDWRWGARGVDASNATWPSCGVIGEERDWRLRAERAQKDEQPVGLRVKRRQCVGGALELCRAADLLELSRGGDHGARVEVGRGAFEAVRGAAQRLRLPPFDGARDRVEMCRLSLDYYPAG